MGKNNGDSETAVKRKAAWNPTKTVKVGGIRYELYCCSGCWKNCRAAFRLSAEPTECVDGVEGVLMFSQNGFKREEAHAESI